MDEAGAKGVVKAEAAKAGAGPRGRHVAAVKARAGVKAAVVARVVAAGKAVVAARAGDAAKVADRRRASRVLAHPADDRLRDLERSFDPQLIARLRAQDSALRPLP